VREVAQARPITSTLLGGMMPGATGMRQGPPGGQTMPTWRSSNCPLESWRWMQARAAPSVSCYPVSRGR